MRMIKNNDYYDYCDYLLSLSRWIGNFGVEPLFLLSFFLFAPIFCALLARLVFVTLVRDTIKNLLYKKNSSSQIEYLHGPTSVVKTILLFFIIFTFNNYLDCNATESNLKSEGKNYSNHSNNSYSSHSTIILSIGEQQEIEIKDLNKFSINNRDIIKAQYFPNNHILIIKGKKIGHSNLSIITKSSIKQLSIFVLPKQQDLKLAELISALKIIKSPISITEVGSSLIVSGYIENIDDYLLIQKLEDKFTGNIIINLNISAALRNQIIGEIYFLLFQEFIKDISCYSKNLDIYCTYDQRSNPSEKLIKSLEELYNITFIPMNTKPAFKNYLLKLKLLQLEKLDGEEFSLGLNRLSGSLNDFFNSGIDNIILRNEVLLENQKVKLSTLAEPKIIIKSAHKILVQMGSDVPYEVKKTAHTNAVEWHFVGLKVNLELTENCNDFSIEYTTEFSQSSKERIDGSKEASKLQIKMGDAIQLFEIGINSNGKKESSLPGASAIPLIGGLFSSTSEQKIYKKIYGLALLQKYDDTENINYNTHYDNLTLK
ncbi:MAG: hypothetical protein HQK51_16540 [Oligoflexia bacterium]|nr:hypothetical protein [Oligoflexia bacterium]